MCIIHIMPDKRQHRGHEIAEKHPDQIKKINKTKYLVKSQTKNGEDHVVFFSKFGWVCTCNDYTFRQKKCKHIWALEFREIIKDKEKKQPTWIIPDSDSINCPFCNSDSFTKYGYRYNKKRKEQRYECSNHNCNKKFVANDGFKKLKYTPDVVTESMDLYFRGLSLRNIAGYWNFRNVEISYQSVYRWLVHYVQLMQKYLNASIIPRVGSTWRADEIFVKIKGHQKYIFMSMDDKTRFWISQEVADTKFHHDATKLLVKAKQVTHTKPVTFITDGSPVYDKGFRKILLDKKADSPIHIHTIHMNGNWNNNIMERLNGEFRDREKVMRGIKKKDSSMIPGYQLFHNYFRPHSSLNGRTPAESAGIHIEGNNKWKTLIQNASKKITPKQYSITEFLGDEIKIPVNTNEDGEMSLDSC